METTVSFWPNVTLPFPQTLLTNVLTRGSGASLLCFFFSPHIPYPALLFFSFSFFQVLKWASVQNQIFREVFEVAG